MPRQHGDHPDPLCRVVVARTSTMLPPWAIFALLGVWFAACAWIAHSGYEHQVLNQWALYFVAFGGYGISGFLLVCSLVKRTELLYSRKYHTLTATLRKPVWSTPIGISLPISALDRIEAVPATASLATQHGLWRRERNRWAVLADAEGEQWLLASDLEEADARRVVDFVLAEGDNQDAESPRDGRMVVDAAAPKD